MMNCSKYINDIILSIRLRNSNTEEEDIISSPTVKETEIIDVLHKKPPLTLIDNESINTSEELPPVDIECTNNPLNKKLPLVSKKNINIYEDTYLLYNRFYLSEFDEKLIIFYNRGRSGIPLEGWFQQCFVCNSYTGQLHHYGEVNDKNIYIRMCEKCGIIYTKYPTNPDNIITTREINQCINNIIF